MIAVPKYRNARTGQVVECDGPRPSFTSSGRWAVESNDDAPPETDEGEAVPPKPSESDRKADWEAYAHALGVLTGDEGDVTKAELIQRCQEGDADGAA